MDYFKHPEREFKHLLTIPFIWALLGPILIIDLFFELYHSFCFPVYGIKKVDRSKYIKIDRHKLEYLDIKQKLNCIYCGYANGVLNYTSAIGAATEKYWCGIKHKSDKEFIEPKYHQDFLEYGDQESYEEEREKSAE
ncbi:hypothetical protein HOB10_00910 [Candidatus Parcubacteria bacterium]|jgi:hypothetical protein|nr:hypothetical protein [Candidatus Parcubacteria bacterium]